MIQKCLAISRGTGHTRRAICFPTVMLLIVTILPAAVAREGAQSPALRSSPKDSPAAARTIDPIAGVTFKEGRLSVTAQALALADVANEIADKAGVPIILDGEVVAQPVSISFQNLALDEGLRQIFRNNDAFFFYGSDTDKPSALKVVWVYPKGKANGVEPVPPEKWASTKELKKMLTDHDPEVRARAIQSLVEREGGQASAAVSEALKDANAAVRASALDGASQAGIELPVQSVRDLALNDPSGDVRFLALQSLAGDPDVKSLAEAALNDPSEPVRVEAQEILRSLAGNQSPQPSLNQQRQPH